MKCKWAALWSTEFPALVRSKIRLPHRSNNFIVVALGGRPLASSCALGEGWGGYVWVVNDLGICSLLLKCVEPTLVPSSEIIHLRVNNHTKNRSLEED